jgi:hypothetical protein
LRSTEHEWSQCNLLAVHNYWHMCLYHLERNEHDKAIQIFDDIFAARTHLNATLDFVDMVSLLYRLQLDLTSLDLTERWRTLRDAYRSRFEHHGYLFNDMHAAMLLACSNKTSDQPSEDTLKFVNSFKEFTSRSVENDENLSVLVSQARSGQKESNYLKKLNRELGAKVFDSFFYFEEGEFDKVVDLLYPIRHDLIRMGGSNAQRDLLSQMLVQAALRSKNKLHNRIGVAVLSEREALKPQSSLTRRIKSRFAAQHLLDE